MQVYCNGRMVGEIALRPSETSGPGVMLTWVEEPELNSFQPGGFDDDCLRPVDAQFRKLWLVPKTRHLAIDRFMMETSPDYLPMVLEANKVPDNAERIEDPMSRGIRMKWSVLDVDQDTFETLFDFDRFTACDENGPDPEIFERRRAGLAFL